jgi:hypothetical protein
MLDETVDDDHPSRFRQMYHESSEQLEVIMANGHAGLVFLTGQTNEPIDYGLCPGFGQVLPEIVKGTQGGHPDFIFLVAGKVEEPVDFLDVLLGLFSPFFIFTHSNVPP